MSRDCEEMEKLEAALKRRFRRKVNGRVLSDVYATVLAKRFAPWIYGKGLVDFHPKRLSIARAKSMLDSVSRNYRWMEDDRRHHGQHAKECARKVLRAILQDKLTCEEILERKVEFGQRRMKAIRVNARMRPFAKPEQFLLTKSGMEVCRLVTAASITHVGRALVNCLAQPDFAHGYVSQARDGAIKLFALHDKGGRPVALLSISIEDNSLMEVKGCLNSRPWKYRLQILVFLAWAGVHCDGCQDAKDLGICDVLLQAHEEGSRVKFKVDCVRYEVAPGVLVVRHGGTIALLQKGCATPGLCVTVNTNDDTTALRQQLRNWLKDALAKDAGLRAACSAAFGGLDVTSKNFWSRDK